MIKGIYFIDGPIEYEHISLMSEDEYTVVLNAAEGPSDNIEFAKGIQKNQSLNANIVTNSIVLMNFDFGWVDGKCSIYLFNELTNSFINIQNLTDKELRRAHNIAKMYMAGSFNAQ